jgi:phospholipid/cholesterol/gamma-HCH transport system substrate-binding protein
MRGRTALQIRRYGRSFLILIALMALGLVAGFYILIQQRLPNPFKTFYSVNAAFNTAAAVVPGLGEPVDVAGVHVGEIMSVEIKNGHGVVKMQIDPTKGVPHLYRDAQAELVPNTPLMDMYVNIQPGTPSAGRLPENGTIPVSETTTQINSDELLDALDTDTRDWFTSLITELANGTRGRGEDIRKLFMTLGPTARQMRTIGDLLAARRQKIALLVHNLGTLSRATSKVDAQLGAALRSGDTTISALASQNAALSRAVSLLPGTLETTRSTLSDLTSFSNELTPTATALLPTVRALPRTLRDTRTLVRGAALLPLNKIKQFEAAVLPLASHLATLSTGLNVVVPELSASFKVLHYVTNELAYNPGGGNPGFSYWLAWFSHNVDSFIGNADANGPAWRTLILSSCNSLAGLPTGQLLEQLLSITVKCTS